MQNLAEPNQLVDICNVSVDAELPKQERLADYVRRIKDPYNFKCGRFTFRARYAEGSPPLEDCLRQIMS
ncbi:MAG: hypothetical protein FWC20_09005 [Oscillospiraceae bacterium]|nr:hypothetical protein [Oscillospiraceae bacterium]MCL2279527.1 hypothetical protein [Oscillospiraceae bacterium]